MLKSNATLFPGCYPILEYFEKKKLAAKVIR